MQLALALLPLLVTACKGEEHYAPRAAGAPGSQTPAQAIKRLEDEGKLPVLDRSDDIAGPDVDHNGIRDDIDAYIAKLEYTDAQRKAVRDMHDGRDRHARAAQIDHRSQGRRFSKAIRLLDRGSDLAVHALGDTYDRAIGSL